MNAVDEARAEDTYQQLMQQVIAGNGLQSVARTVAQVLETAVIVTDDEFETLHFCAPGDGAVDDAEARVPGALRGRVSFELHPEASISPPTRMVGESHASYIVAPVVLQRGIVGYVWVACNGDGHRPQWERVVSHAAAASAVEMLRQQAVMEGESRVRYSFLGEVLSGSVASANSVRRRARFLGYDLRGEQLVLVLDIDHFLTYIRRHHLDERDIQRLKDRFRRSVDACIPAVWSSALIWEQSDSMVVLVPAGRDVDRRTLRARVEVLRAGVEARLGGPSVSAGVGRVYADLMKLQHSYREAEHAVSIGVAVSGPSTTTSFDDLGAHRLLFHLRDQPELRTFCEETIGALLRYDAERGSHLADTLAGYLEMQGNLSQTARALHLHRNGLLYRLARIEKIVGCDLSSPEQRLALQLALLARPLLQGKRSSPPHAPRPEA